MKKSAIRKLASYSSTDSSDSISPSDSANSNLVKIGEASQIIGVSIDTLRRWEKKGWLKVTKTPGGTRLYNREQLVKLNPNLKRGPKSLISPIIQNQFQPTTATASFFTANPFNFTTPTPVVLNSDKPILKISESIKQHQIDTDIEESFTNPTLKGNVINPITELKSILKKSVVITFAVLLLILPLIFANNYLKSNTYTSTKLQLASNTNPVKISDLAQSIANIFSPRTLHALLGGYPNGSPPGSLYGKIIKTPDQLASGRVSGDIKGTSLSRSLGTNGEVLADSTPSGSFLQINLDTQINGSLSVDTASVSGTLSSATINTGFGDNEVYPMNQPLLTSSSPSFAGLNLSALTLSAASNQLTLGNTIISTQTGGSGAFTASIPTLTSNGNFVIDNASQTLTNKIISGSNNTITNIPNSALSSSSITINAGSGLSGGGEVSLGGSITLTATGGSSSGVTSITGTADQIITSSSTGDITLSLPQSIAITSSPEFTNLTLSDLDANGVVFTTGAGLLDTVTTVSTGECLLSNGAGAPSWGSCFSGSTSFTIAGDSGPNQSISSGDTLTINGDSNIATAGVNTDNFSITLSNALTGINSIDTIAVSSTNLTFAGAGTIYSTTSSAITLDSGTTGTVNLGTGNNAKTINLGTGTAGNIINLGTNNTVADVINIGSALDTTTIAGTLNISGLTASSAVYTDGSKNLTSTAPTSGAIGYWSRTGTTLSPTTSGDAVTTSGNISTTSTGTGTFAGTLTASNGFTQTTGALNLTSTSGAISSTGLTSATLSVTSGTLALATATSGDITLTTGATAGLVNVLTGNLKVGSGTPTVSLNGADAYVTGTFETDGNARFDGLVGISGSSSDSQLYITNSAFAGNGGNGRAAQIATTFSSSVTSSGYGLLSTVNTEAASYTLTNLVAMYAGTNTAGAGSTVTNNYGLFVDDQTAGTNDYGIRVDAADTATLWVSGGADNTTANAGIMFGSSRDTNLYRSAANTLKTDDAFNVGGNFNVTAAGVISGATGLTSSGTINFSGLTASSAVYTDASKNLTSTAPTSGAIGYWSRTGTTLTPTTANDIVSLATTNTTGADLGITNTGVYTGTGILNLTANSATTGNLASITGTGMTTGELLNIDGTYAPSDGSTNEAIDINITHTPTSVADIFKSIDLTTTDGTALDTNVWGMLNTVSLTGNAAKGAMAYRASVSSTSTTADSLYGYYATTSSSGIITSGTRNIYGFNSEPVAGAESTGGITNVFGVYSKPSVDVGAGGTANGYGLYVGNGTYDTDGTSTQYGLYVEALSGADNNYGAYFGSNVGIGDTTPTAALTVGSGDLFQVNSSGNLTFNQTAPTVTIGNTGTLTFNDGTNDLVQIVDIGTEGVINFPNAASVDRIRLFNDTDKAKIAGGSNYGVNYHAGQKSDTLGSHNFFIGDGVNWTPVAVLNSTGVDFTGTLTAGTSNGFQVNSTGNISSIGATSHGISNSSGELLIDSAGSRIIFNDDIQLLGGGVISDSNNNEAIVINSTTNAVNHIKIFNAATGNGPSISAVGSDTNVDLNFDGQAAGAINIGNNSTGDVLLAGGSGATGCTVTNSNGNLTCTGNISGASTGTVGYWSRSGTTLSTANAGDNVTVDGTFDANGIFTIGDGGDTGAISTSTLGVTSTGTQTFTSSVSSGTTTGSAFVLNASSLSSGTALRITSTSTSGKLVDLNATNTSGTIFNLAYGASTTLSGDLTGLLVDLNSGNVDATNQNLTGVNFKIPTVTNTITSGTKTLTGMLVNFGSGAGINQNGAGGTLEYIAGDFHLPALTQTAGTLNAYGTKVTTPATITTGGTAYGNYVLATGVGAGTLSGLGVSSITGGAGTEYALNIGTGWDAVLRVGSTTVINGSGVTQVAGGGTGLSTITQNGVVYGNAASNLGVTAAGTTGQVLIATTGSAPSWGTISGSSCSNCVITDPAADQTIAPTGQGTTGLTVRQTSTASPTDDIFQVTDSAGSTKYFWVDKDGNVSTAGTSSQTLTLTPLTDITALTLVGTNVTTQPLQYINANNSQGSIINLNYGAAQTLSTSTALTAFNIDLSTNVTATNASVMGTHITLPGTTNTHTSGTKTLTGFSVDGGSINQNGAGGTTTFTAFDATIPAITQTAGTMLAYGINVNTPSSITTAGTASGINITATGVGAGTLNGVNVGSITAGAGTENGIQIGSGWDTNLLFNDTSTRVAVADGGTITILDTAGNSLCTITDSGSAGDLSCSGTISGSGSVGFWSKTGTTLSPATANDIVSIANTTTTGADFALTNTGVYTGTGIFNLTANSTTTGNLASLTGTGLTTGEILNIDGTYAPSNGSDNEAIDINLTFTPTSSAATLRGLDLNLTEGANALANTDYGVRIAVDNSANTSTGTHSIYGGYFAATGKTAGTTTAYGVYGVASGADTNYALYADGVLGFDDVSGSNTGYIKLDSQTVGSGQFYFKSGGTNNVLAAFQDCCNDVFRVKDTDNASEFRYGLDIDNGESATGTGLKNSFTQSDDGDASDIGSALQINVTSSSGDADTLYALDITNLTAGTATETAIKIGTGWDNILDSASIDITGAGVISGATGLTSSGTINFSGLTASSAVYTDGSKNLTSTAPTSGAIGYWSRSGTTLSPTTSGDSISFTGNLTAGGASAQYSSIYSFLRSGSFSDAPQAAGSFQTTISGGGGSSTVPIGLVGSVDMSGGTVNHLVGVLGLTDDTYGTASTWFGTEGRSEANTNGDVVTGVKGLAYFDNATSSSSIGIGVVGEVDKAVSSGAGLVGIGGWFRIADGSGACTVCYNAVFGQDTDNYRTQFRGAINGGASYANFSLDDTYNQLMIDTYNGGSNVVPSGVAIKLGDAASAAELSILDSAGSTVASIDSDGNLLATGVVNITTLNASSAVYTDGSKNLTSTAPTSGAIGYWSRSSTILSPTTAGDTVLLDNNTAYQMKDSGGLTRNLVSLNSSDLQTFGLGTFNAVYNGYTIDITSAYPSGQTTSSAFDIKSINNLGATDELVQFGDSAGDFLTVLGSGFVGIGVSDPGYKLTVGGVSDPYESAAFIRGSTDVTSEKASMRFDAWEVGQDSSGNGTENFFFYDNNNTALRLVIDTSGNLTLPSANTDLIFNNAEAINNDTNGTLAFTFNGTSGLNMGSTGITSLGNVAHTIVNSGGALAIDSNSTGAINIGTGANAKTITMGNATGATALAFNSGTGSQTFTSQVVSGTTTTSAFVFDSTALTTGTGSYFTSDSITQGKLMQIATTGNTLTSGTLADIRTTSTALTGTAGTGSLLNLDWSPGSATSATGDLFSLNIGTNGSTTGKLFNILDTASSIFSVSETSFTTSLPSNFTSAGDVAVAYDLNFTNPTASYIKSAAPLSMVAGETFNSSNLTLQTYNQGTIVFDTATTTGTAFSMTNSAMTTGIGLRYDFSGVTSGRALYMTGPTSTGVTTGFARIDTAVGNVGQALAVVPTYTLAGGTAYGLYVPSADNTSSANELRNIYSGVTMTGNAAKVGIGIKTAVSSTSTTGDTMYGGEFLADHNTAVTSGNTTLYGIQARALNDGITDTNGATIYGGHFTATGNTGGTSTAYGVYATVSGSDNNYPFYSGVAFPTANTAGLCWDNAGESAIYDCNGTPTDLAENYGTSDTSIEAGDVVVMSGQAQQVLDPREGKITTKAFISKANSSYQSNVIGIVSTNPNQVYGEDGLFSPSENPRPVSLAGRVPVKVSTENGAITAGDYLTSSSTPGVAMKATQPGVSIGRALSDFNGSGVGRVIVYVDTGYADPTEALANLLIGNDGSLLGSNLNLDKITVATTGTFGGLVSASNFALDASLLNRTGSLASVPVNSNKVTLADTVNALNNAVNQNAQVLGEVQSNIASQSAELAEAKILGEQAISHAETLDEKVASTSANLSSLSSRIDELLASISGESNEGTDSGQLALTPPSELIATDSAVFTNVNVTENLSTLNLEALDATISATFKSLGETFLGQTTIAGDLSIDGTMSFTNGNSINAFPVLFFQNNPLAEAVDFFNGKVTIDKLGSISAEALALGTESVGELILPAGQTQITIPTSLVAATSKIFLTPLSPLSGNLYPDTIIPGQSFKVKVSTPNLSDIKFNWMIVQSKEAQN